MSDDSVVNSPEETRKFAGQLNKFNQNVLQCVKEIRSHKAALGQTWRDKQFKSFSEGFDQTMKKFEQFVTQVCVPIVPALKKKADLVEAAGRHKV